MEGTKDQVYQQEEQGMHKSKKNNIPPFKGILLVIVLFAGIFIFRNLQNKSISGPNLNPSETSKSTEENSIEVQNPSGGANSGNSDLGVLTVMITASNYQFNPSTFTVSPGQEVNLIIKDDNGTHALVFDNLDIGTGQLMSGNEEALNFTAPKTPGRYTFHCPVDGHQGLGMVGTMIVQ